MHLRTAVAAVTLTLASMAVTSPAGARLPGDTPQYKRCAYEDGTSCVFIDSHDDGPADDRRPFVTGNDGPNGDGDNDGRIFHVSRQIARKVIRHDHWERVPWRLVGETADLVDGRHSKVITRLTVWSVGDTTLFIWPHSGAVGTS